MDKFMKVEIAMRMLQEDSSTPRSVREKLHNMINYIRQAGDDSTKVSNVLSQLEDFCNDVNIPSHVRNQIFSISAMLEQINIEQN
jgi:uncharacterized protein (UPF0147 family)